jgi:hypothetical protein
VVTKKLDRRNSNWHHKRKKSGFFGHRKGNRTATGELCDRVGEEIQQIDGVLIIFSLVYASRMSMEELKYFSYKRGE